MPYGGAQCSQSPDGVIDSVWGRFQQLQHSDETAVCESRQLVDPGELLRQRPHVGDSQRSVLCLQLHDLVSDALDDLVVGNDDDLPATDALHSLQDGRCSV